MEVELTPQSIPLPLEVTVTGYFFQTFCRSGMFSYLPGFATMLCEDEISMQALCASALGSMALQYNSSDLSHSARGYYANSLTSVNRALADPESRLLDSTLLHVLMLSAFEALNLHQDGNPRDWAAHIEGSCRLLVLRGKAQLRTTFGRLLFHHAAVNILIHSMIEGKSVPAELHHLVRHAISYPGEMDFASTHILSMLSGMGVLVSKVRSMNVFEVLENVLPLEEEACNFLQELYDSEPYEVVGIAESGDERRQNHPNHPNLTFEGVMHLYQDQQSARMYNTARLMRLILRQWLFAATNRSGKRRPAPDLNHTSVAERDTILQKMLLDSACLVGDFLASVPYTLAILDSQNSTEARYLIWPLARIASLDVCPSSAKLYISNRLAAIAAKFNLRRAMEAAIMLQQGGADHQWRVAPGSGKIRVL